MIRLPDDVRRAAREAHQHAERLLSRVPREVLAQLDAWRADPPVGWPDWCLMPMGAAAGLMGQAGMAPAMLSALYAWRQTRSVWVVEPALAGRLLGQVPDALDAGQITGGLPEWCVYIAVGDPEWPGGGIWVHLEFDVNTGRPELRLLYDMGDDDPAGATAIPVYLDRPTITEALADMRATTAATATSGGTGLNVRGGDADADVAALADRIDQAVSVVGYLCRPEADIAPAGTPADRPRRYRRRPSGRQTWAVGYTL